MARVLGDEIKFSDTKLEDGFFDGISPGIIADIAGDFAFVVVGEVGDGGEGVKLDVVGNRKRFS